MLIASLALTACGRDDDQAARGVTDTKITIGGTFPFTGPLATAGALSKGFSAYVGAVNAAGGVNGRKIEYKALDDAYDPSRVASNARRLVQQEQVFALITSLGPAVTIRPFLEEQKTPQFNMGGLSAMSEVDRFPHSRAWWPDSALESAIVTRYALSTGPNVRVGTLMLNNDLGVDMTTGIKKGLGSRGSALVKETRFDATQLDVTSQINQLRSAKIDVLVSSATGATAIQMLKYIHQIGWKVKVFLYSGSTSEQAILSKAGLDRTKGVYSALWLRDPADPQWSADAGMRSYQRDVERYGDGADPKDLYTANGYAGAQAFVAALKTMKDPTQEGLLKAFDALKPTTLPLLQPGITLRPGPGGRLLDQYQIVRFDGRSWKPVGKPVDARAAGFTR
jgi:branched-chain amino acid transport system substrate-binding protein